MSLFKSDNPKEKQHSGVLGAFSTDVIKWEPESDAEASILAHKYEYEDFPNGSYLIVGPSQMAVFVNNMSAGNSLEANGDGEAQVSTFIGPCKIKLETGDSRFAPFRNIAHSLTGGESAFHSTVYFINTTYMNDLNWGTQSPIQIEDPEEGVNVHVRAFGLFGAHIEQEDPAQAVIAARRFLQRVVGTRSDYTRTELVSFMRAKILEFVPTLLAKSMIDEGVGILKISTKLTEFSQDIYSKLIEHFGEFGYTLDNFSFTNINVPDEELRLVNEAKIRKKQAHLDAEGNADKMDIESAARQRMREREGYTYQQEKAFDVMNTAAGNEGASSGMMGTGMGLGMGLGLGGAFGGAMGNIAQTAMGNPATFANAQAPAGQAAPAGDGVKCRACGNINPAGSKFCFKCGEKIINNAVCPDCGRELVPGALFCPFCGRKLINACPKCGAELPAGAMFCAKCGEKL